MVSRVGMEGAAGAVGTICRDMKKPQSSGPGWRPERSEEAGKRPSDRLCPDFEALFSRRRFPRRRREITRLVDFLSSHLVNPAILATGTVRLVFTNPLPIEPRLTSLAFSILGLLTHLAPSDNSVMGVALATHPQ